MLFYAKKKILTGAKGNRIFKQYHALGSLVYLIDPLKLVERHQIGNLNQNLVCFVGKSRQHAASISLTLNPKTIVCPNFHILHDYDF